MDSHNLRFSVIIPAYQAEETIPRCLEALSHQTVAPDLYEILVVDDASTDHTRERVQAFPPVRLLTQPHAGAAAARNLGLRRARGPLVLFTDSDCEPAPDWIERMVAPLQDPGVAGSKGAYRTRQRELVARFVQLEYEDKYDRMRGQEAIDFVDTYSACYRRELLLAAGGFDTAFPGASVEDQELSFRLARQGHRLVFAPDAIVNHWGHPPTVSAYARRKFGVGYWKTLVLRRYPEKAVRDSHTPQVMKAQLLLVAAGGLCLAAGLVRPALAWGGALAAGLFLLSTMPFVRKAWRKDRAVAAVAPLLLLVRALSLGTGLAGGFLTLGPAGRPAAAERDG